MKWMWVFQDKGMVAFYEKMAIIRFIRSPKRVRYGLHDEDN